MYAFRCERRESQRRLWLSLQYEPGEQPVDFNCPDSRLRWESMVRSGLLRLTPAFVYSAEPIINHGLFMNAILPFLESKGYCHTCCQTVRFCSMKKWLRDNFICTNCGSIPRERALMRVIDERCPKWREFVLHESSPAARGASNRLRTECGAYIASNYSPDYPPGSTEPGGTRVENLEALTFSDSSVDLHVTQDVLEHVFDPAAAFREIERTLKPGGMHIFTVPLVRGDKPSVTRASTQGGSIVHHLPAQYHGNPIGDGKSLVVTDWGYDICNFIHESSGLFTQIIEIDDISQGIRAELNHVLISIKPEIPLSPIALQHKGDAIGRRIVRRVLKFLFTPRRG